MWLVDAAVQTSTAELGALHLPSARLRPAANPMSIPPGFAVVRASPPWKQNWRGGRTVSPCTLSRRRGRRQLGGARPGDRRRRARRSAVRLSRGCGHELNHPRPPLQPVGARNFPDRALLVAMATAAARGCTCRLRADRHRQQRVDVYCRWRQLPRHRRPLSPPTGLGRWD